MKRWIHLLLLSLISAGCASSPGEPKESPQAVIVTPVAPRPDTRLRARIQSVNDRGQFVVMDFGLGAIPPIRTKMNIYRGEEIVGVLRLTGPVVENIAAGDIVSGDARVGDEAIWDVAVSD